MISSIQDWRGYYAGVRFLGTTHVCKADRNRRYDQAKAREVYGMVVKRIQQEIGKPLVVKDVRLCLCQKCLDGWGGECNIPECAFHKKQRPGQPVCPDQVIAEFDVDDNLGVHGKSRVPKY